MIVPSLLIFMSVFYCASSGRAARRTAEWKFCVHNYDKLASERQGELSNAVRERVTAARQLQADRFRGTRMLTNADMGPAEVRTHCQLDGAGQRLMQAAMRQLHLSARAYHRVLKLARTIADLANVAEISPAHLAEAIQYRPRRVE